MSIHPADGPEPVSPPRRRARLTRSATVVVPAWSRVAMVVGLLVVVMVVVLASTRGLLSGAARPALDGKTDEPFIRRLVTPSYPAQAAARGEEGRVVVMVRVDSAGRPFDTDVVRSSGCAALDSAARTAAASSEFSAYVRAGQRTSTKTVLSYVFDLEPRRAALAPVRPEERRLLVVQDTVRTVRANADGVSVTVPADLSAESLHGARLTAMVEADGSVSRVVLQRGTGSSSQDSAVRSYIGRLMFGRPSLNGRPVRCWLEMPTR